MTTTTTNAGGTRTIATNEERRRQLRTSRAEKDRIEAGVMGDILKHYIVWAQLALTMEPTLVLAQASVAAARQGEAEPDAAQLAPTDDE